MKQQPQVVNKVSGIRGLGRDEACRVYKTLHA